MNLINALTVLLAIAGAFFFFAGTVGLLRFPDVYSRLHALTKADNIGLGLIIAAIALQTGSITVVVKLIFIWILALVAAATNGYLIANSAKGRDQTGGEEKASA